jgi:Zn-dependent protease with chaperone function
VNPHYVTWCDQCNWNIEPTGFVQPRTIAERFYERIGQRLGQSMLQEVCASPIKRTWSLSMIIALAIALLVHLLTLALAVGGALLLWQSNWNFFGILFGGLCLGLAWLMRPELGKLPEQTLPREQYRQLYQLTEQIAKQMGARPPILVIDEQFNASYREVGLQRQPVITLGLPLFAILNPQERVAILAHELAHGVNGDLTRGLMVGSALNALIRWHRIFQPDALQSDLSRYQSGTTAGFVSLILNLITNQIMRLLALIPWLGSYLLVHLLWRSTQRAEYYADLLAAQTASSAAKINALNKIHYLALLRVVVQRMALAPEASQRTGPAEVIEPLRTELRNTPEREIERIRRAELASGMRLDTTHPPTPYRIQHIQAHPIATPTITLSDADSAQIDRELRQAEPKVYRALVDSYIENLYYH